MLSGVETAGLVLAVIPLIIAALENYKFSQRRWALFRRKEIYMSELIAVLWEQKMLLEADLEILLRAAGARADTVVKVKADGWRPMLKENAILNNVRTYLGERYSAYESAVFRCEAILKNVAQAINGLLPESSVSLFKQADGHHSDDS